MHPDTGEPQDTLTPKAKQLIQDLGSQNTKVPKIIAQEDRAVFTAIQEGLDKANKHATSNTMKVGYYAAVRNDWKSTTLKRPYTSTSAHGFYVIVYTLYCFPKLLSTDLTYGHIISTCKQQLHIILAL